MAAAAALCTAYALYSVVHVAIRVWDLNDNSFVSKTVGTEQALIAGERSGMREKREERERSA
jgi:hypothetical protein